MDLSELKKLIPFYVAGTLDPLEHEIVKRELDKSKELQDELRFWQTAKIGVKSHFEYLAQNHLTSEEIVDYADGDLNADLLKKVESHLHDCEQCRKEVGIIKDINKGLELIPSPTFGENKISIFEKIKEWLSEIKPVYAIPAIATICIAVFITIGVLRKPSAPPITATGQIAEIALNYSDEVRAGSKLPVIEIERGAATAKLTLKFPIQEIFQEYRLALSTPLNPSIEIAGTFKPTDNSLTINLPGNYFTENGAFALKFTGITNNEPINFRFELNVR